MNFIKVFENRLSPLLRILLSGSACIFLAAPSQAAEVAKVKDKSVILKLNADEASQVQEGDKAYVLNAAGKKKGIITISRIKGSKALGQLRKGKAEEGEEVIFSKGSGGSSDTDSGSDSTAATGRSSKLQVGGLIGYSVDQQDVKPANATVNPSLRGGGINLNGFADYTLMDKLGLRVEAGLEQFNATGDGGGTSYFTKINYFDMGFALRYRFMDEKIKAYAGAGLVILVPLTKDANAVSGIGATSALDLKLGMQLPVGPKYFIPFQFDYLYFPPSDSVKTVVLSVKTGLGWAF